MKKCLVFILLIMVSLSGNAFAGEYGKNLWRGFKNIIGSPLEIPITVQEYHEGPGKPVIRHLAGAVDGSMKMVLRAGSGLWDWLFGWIPNHQEGLPLDPETLF